MKIFVLKSQLLLNLSKELAQAKKRKAARDKEISKKLPAWKKDALKEAKQGYEGAVKEIASASKLNDVFNLDHHYGNKAWQKHFRNWGGGDEHTVNKLEKMIRKISLSQAETIGVEDGDDYSQYL